MKFTSAVIASIAFLDLFSPTIAATNGGTLVARKKSKGAKHIPYGSVVPGYGGPSAGPIDAGMYGTPEIKVLPTYKKSGTKKSGTKKSKGAKHIPYGSVVRGYGDQSPGPVVTYGTPEIY